MTGQATPEHIARLLPLALPPESVVDILLGGIPTSADWQATGIERADDRWKVEVRGLGSEHGYLWVDPGRRVTTAFAMLDPSGEEQVRVRFDDFGAVTGAAGPFPRQIRVTLASPEADVRIKLDAPELGVQLDAGLFRIDPPSGVHPEPL